MRKQVAVLEQEMFTIETTGRGFTDITAIVRQFVDNSRVSSGLCNLFLLHTSASLILCENADPDVLVDLGNYFQAIVPERSEHYLHRMEGPDDMPAHIRSVLTLNSLCVPVQRGHCVLGTWQGIFLWEHRKHGHRRQLMITLQGPEIESPTSGVSP